MNNVSPGYAELHCLSNHTFLRGASHPEELVARAARNGYAALALTDACSVSGVVRAHVAAKRTGLPLIVGSEFRLDDGTKFVLLATDRRSYGRLCALITLGRRAAAKGEYRLGREQVASQPPSGLLALWLPDEEADRGEPESEPLCWLAGLCSGATWIGVELLLNGRDLARLGHLRALGRRCGIPLTACGDVHMHARGRRALQDTLTAIRLGTPLAECGFSLYPNGERHLRTRAALAELYPPELLEETVRIAARCCFSLDELRYEYPSELVPEGTTPAAWLRRLVERGIARRWPGGTPERVRKLVGHELALVAELSYEPYFLTVHDIVRFARERGILCQGRGSAANSAICYCLGITEVDPTRMNLLFERFISRERDEPPDIDVDFEHERREEVIQYIYGKYGRERAALAATVITYRSRSAIRDVGKALGFSLDQVGRLAKTVQWWDGGGVRDGQIREAGFAPDNPMIHRLTVLVDTLIGFPRHLSQHVGGFVISRGPLSELVPVENATMQDRTVIQWEKDDLEVLGLLKVDVLALGMLSAIRKALSLVSGYDDRVTHMADIPPEDPAVYDMICKADTVGVFQIESRAQMSMLPRLRPRNYYDLVIEIAIVRPGPIQGDMVHPYLARRSGRAPVSYPSEVVRSVLERTLGVPIFQEQVMQLAMVAAGFSAGEADQLRRGMAAWKRKGGLDRFEPRLLEGMRSRGYTEAFARQIFSQIKGFGEYGFPESHSASFALLAYVSAWLKRHHPAAFTCALLNSQPMGFYAPAQLVQDARRHGVEVRPVDVRYSAWDCTLESAAGTEWQPLAGLHGARATGIRTAGPVFPGVRESPQTAVRGPDAKGRHALRLGLRRVKGLSRHGGESVARARSVRPFEDTRGLVARTGLNRRDLECLAAADALAGLEGHRHNAWWRAGGIESPLPLFGVPRLAEEDPMLREPTEGEDIVADYASTGMTLRRHPLALLRARLAEKGYRSAADLATLRNGAVARGAGLVLVRQRPATASGVIFTTLEDETGNINVVVWPSTAEMQRKALLKARLLAVTGTLQRESGVTHLVAGRLEDLTEWLGDLEAASRDFH